MRSYGSQFFILCPQSIELSTTLPRVILLIGREAHATMPSLIMTCNNKLMMLLPFCIAHLMCDWLMLMWLMFFFFFFVSFARSSRTVSLNAVSRSKRQPTAIRARAKATHTHSRFFFLKMPKLDSQFTKFGECSALCLLLRAVSIAFFNLFNFNSVHFRFFTKTKSHTRSGDWRGHSIPETK